MLEKLNGPAAETRFNKKQKKSNSNANSADESYSGTSLCSPLHSQEVLNKVAKSTKWQLLNTFVLNAEQNRKECMENYSDSELVHRKYFDQFW